MTNKTLVIAVKGVRQMWRNKRNLVFVIIFPIMFMFVFRIAVGFGLNSATTYPIAVVDLDTGTGPWNATDPPWMSYVRAGPAGNVTAPEFFRRDILQNASSGGEFFIDDVLKKARYEDNTTKQFSIRRYATIDEGWKAVSDRDVVALVVIPVNFTSALQGQIDAAVMDEVRAHGVSLNYTMPAYGDAVLQLSGELTNFDYSFAASMISGQLQGYTQALYHIIRAEVGAEFPLGPVSEAAGSVMADYVGVEKANNFTVFDIMVPGLIVFGIMMQAMGVTATLGMEKKNKTLNRLRLTKMTSFDMMAGTTIRWMLLCVVQVLLFFGVALLLGAHVGGFLPVTIAGSILIGLVVAIATIALGLIVSAFVDDPRQAIQISVVIVMPLAFFTGAFFPIDLPGATVLPWNQGATALRQMMLYASWSEAMLHTAYMLVGAIVLFIIGVLVYSRNRLRAN